MDNDSHKIERFRCCSEPDPVTAPLRLPSLPTTLAEVRARGRRRVS